MLARETFSERDIEMSRLRQRLDELAEDNRQIRSEIGASPSVDFVRRCRRVLGLSPSRAKMLAILMTGKVKSRNGIWLAYCDPSKERPDIYVIDTLLSYLRKALRPYGVTIDNVWGQGWVMDDASRALVRSLLGLEAAAQ